MDNDHKCCWTMTKHCIEPPCCGCRKILQLSAWHWWHFPRICITLNASFQMDSYVRGSPFDSHSRIQSTLYFLLEGLLNRDESFAQAFFNDRPALERMVKMMKGVVVRDGTTTCVPSRTERSAGLYCIVLGCRLTRMDDFALELCLPLLMVGALSGVLAYCQNSAERVPSNFSTTSSSQHHPPPSPRSSSVLLSPARETTSHGGVHLLVSVARYRCCRTCQAISPTLVRRIRKQIIQYCLPFFHVEHAQVRATFNFQLSTFNPLTAERSNR